MGDAADVGAAGCGAPACGPGQGVVDSVEPMDGAAHPDAAVEHGEHGDGEGSTPDHSEDGDATERNGDEDEQPLTQGWVRKRQRDTRDGKKGPLRHFRRWSRRWMVVGRGRVRWYMTEAKTELRQDYSLVRATVEQHHYSNTPNTIIVRLNLGGKKGKELSVELASREEMREWLIAFKTEIAVCSVFAHEMQDGAVDAFNAFVQRRLSITAEAEAQAAGEDANALADQAAAQTADEGDREPRDTGEASPPPAPLPSSRVSVPTMTICILAVGTRGDVQPFTALGKKLRAYGHRVRLATHEPYRQLVLENGLEFYPLSGDPKKLSSFMVKSQGRLIPDILNPEEIYRDLPEKMSVIRDILFSTWPACSAPDPEDPHLKPFLADAIISNPVSYGHIHCAEALNVPLHMMFPQPWTPTKAFPHPLSNQPQDRGWSYDNLLSYHLVDEFMWLGTESFINEFRKKHLGLEAIRRGEGGGYLLNANKVPFAKMWSPSLVPRPKDWEPHIDVVGNFFTSSKDDVSPYDPSPELAAFLSDRKKPIFVGFGSMIIEDTASLVGIIVEAARRSNCRVLLQSSWSEMRGEDLPDFVFALGNCPHDWLMPQMAAVVHHGGAGTVAAGLRAGKPTMVCPFFGDQHFWGAMVHRAGVGVQPCPIVELTADILTEAFKALSGPELQTAADAMAQSFDEEDGVQGGFEAFHRHLPVEDMVCDVSLFQKRSALARVYCAECGLKLSLEADHVIHDLTDDPELRRHVRNDYRYADLGVVGPATVSEGLYQGLNSFVHETGIALGGIVREPVRGAMRSGVAGAAYGTVVGIVNLVRRPIKGGVILVDKVGVGIANQVERDRTDDAITIKPRRYIFRQNFVNARRETYADIYDQWRAGAPAAAGALQKPPSFFQVLQGDASGGEALEGMVTIEEFRKEGIGHADKAEVAGATSARSASTSPTGEVTEGDAGEEAGAEITGNDKPHEAAAVLGTGSSSAAEAPLPSGPSAPGDAPVVSPQVADLGPKKRGSWRDYLGLPFNRGRAADPAASPAASPVASPAASNEDLRSVGHARLPLTQGPPESSSNDRASGSGSFSGILHPVSEGISGLLHIGSVTSLDLPRPSPYNHVLNPLEASIADEILQAYAKAREVHQLFMDIAEPGSPFIGKAAIMKALGGADADTRLAEQLVEVLDTSGDGRLNFAEFCLMVRNLIKRDPGAFDNRFAEALEREKKLEAEVSPKVDADGAAPVVVATT